MVSRCPLCKQQTVWEHNPFRPFCSERCQLLDLGAWLDERYRVPDDHAHASSLHADATLDERD
ncbi:MAG: DNA gyrase inhibitor YacG [Nitrospirae bacterium]|nr:MAG: DNA gyrase inhibitor YacG [Nitrospirota bacterium]